MASDTKIIALRGCHHRLDVSSENNTCCDNPRHRNLQKTPAHRQEVCQCVMQLERIHPKHRMPEICILWLQGWERLRNTGSN